MTYAMRHTTMLTLPLILLLAAAGCGWRGADGKAAFAYDDGLAVAKGSAAAGDGQSVLFQGKPLALAGMGVKVGDRLRDVRVATADLSLVNIAEGSGKVRIISIVPSLDTKVCEQQTHYLSEKNGGLDRQIELVTVSVDTPFAQKRFAKEAGITNITFLSDYRGGDFGKAHGLLVEGPHILARTVMVVDTHNVVRYLQITPELAQMPDMEVAFKAAKALL